MTKPLSHKPTVTRIQDLLPAIQPGAHWPHLTVAGLLRSAGSTVPAADPVTGVAFAVALRRGSGELAMSVSYLGTWHKGPTRHALDYNDLEDYLHCRADALPVGGRILTTVAFNDEGYFWSLDRTPVDQRCVEMIRALKEF